MTGNYRVVLVLDGGENSLTIPLLCLNHLINQQVQLSNDSQFFNWIDVVVASGDATLLAALIAQNSPKLTLALNEFEKGVFRDKKTIATLISDHFQDETSLFGLKKHYSFVCADEEMNEPYFFSSTRQITAAANLKTVLKACVNDTGLNKKANWSSKQLAYAQLSMRNPIYHAANLASCLYHDESLIFISIGSGLSSEPTEEQIVVEEAHEKFEQEQKTHKNWHYVRFNPSIEKNISNEQLLANVRLYFETEKASMERLMRLMEMKTGRIL